MTATKPLPIFDGHNDTLLSLHFAERGGGRTFFERSDQGHIDLPRAREGGLGGGFCAVFVPSENTAPVPADPDKAAQQALAAFGDERTMPPTPDLASAQRAWKKQTVQASDGHGLHDRLGQRAPPLDLVGGGAEPGRKGPHGGQQIVTRIGRDGCVGRCRWPVEAGRGS